VAENLAAGGTENAIDRDRAGVRLDEVHRFLRAHIEALPIERQRLAVLLDRGGVTRLTDLTRAQRHLTTARCAGPCSTGGDEQETDNQPPGKRTAPTKAINKIHTYLAGTAGPKECAGDNSRVRVATTLEVVIRRCDASFRTPAWMSVTYRTVGYRMKVRNTNVRTGRVGR
jgi:hypothetical protein